jgi:hypothetical protein
MKIAVEYGARIYGSIDHMICYGTSARGWFIYGWIRLPALGTFP